MKNLFAIRGARLWFIVVTGILLLFVAYLRYHARTKPPGPAVPVLSSCKELKPGMRRIGERLGFQFNAPVFKFDVPVDDFNILEARPYDTDAHGYTLTRKSGTSYMDISWGSQRMTMGRVPEDPALVYSGPAERRRIFDDTGNAVGEDSWGNWGNGERWRHVRLRGWVVARYGSFNEKDTASYGSVHQKDAELFDRVIGSACLLSAPDSTK